MDFFQICTKEVRGSKKGELEVYPDFTVGRSKDLMVRGQSFYALWDEERGLWTTDEYDLTRLVDEAIAKHVEKLTADGVLCKPKFLRSWGTNGWKQFRTFVKNVSDNSHQLDAKVVFSNTDVKKSDYATRKLPYPLVEGEHPAFDELMQTLYSEEELAKIKWAIGSIIAGDSKDIQKFIALYGAPGTGKGTVLDIIKKLFPGYYETFEAKALVGGTNNFATEAFKNNPLIAIDPDSKMDKIEDNTKFNSITSHDELRLNEKFKPTYTTKINSFVIIGTNDPIKITNGKSGLIRRIIDVQPTGNLVPISRYHKLMAQVNFELGPIAHHCLTVYRSMGKNYYNDYRAVSMMLKTDPFLNFIEYNYDIFKEQDGTSLKQAFTLYKQYAEESELGYKMAMFKFREELKNYFREFHDRKIIDGVPIRSYFEGFTAQPYKTPLPEDNTKFTLVLEETTSLLDELFADMPAQYGKAGEETPEKYWTGDERLIKGEMRKPRPDQIVKTTLKDLDTSKLHFLKIPENHIVIDFDLEGDDGEKSLERNLEAAAEWPATYAEYSKSGKGVHLHYIYDGDATDLARVYSPGIEIKVYAGNASLRRQLSKCNNVPIATISSGLPFKEKKPVIDAKTIQNEKGLRTMIARNLRKEIHPDTKSSVDFIAKLLNDAYLSGMSYDLTDLRPVILTFAASSSNQALNCIKVVKVMKFKSEETAESKSVKEDKKLPVVIFDCEVYPNLFVLCWKYKGSKDVVRMINPTPQAVEGLFQFKLIGFYNRKYDNHILWGRYMGYNNEQLFQLSTKLVSNDNDNSARFGEAYSLSYADIYEFASKKQSLKKWEIELGLHHMEMDLPWDEPVDEKDIPRVVEYCVNDVNATDAVLDACEVDFQARQILASMSGLSINDTTRMHTGKIIFGNDKTPQDWFNYTDLSQEFPGYTYDYGTSTYRGEDPGEGGYVYAEPGMYENVALLDVASMHPTTIIQLDLFGKYTKEFEKLYRGRLAVKHANEAWKNADKFPNRAAEFRAEAEKFIEEAKKYLPGIEITKENAKALAEALKLAINSVYGYTSAKFPNLFRDNRNVDNIVAKRGALFMVDLKHFIQERGFQVVHIKTDSVKIPNATPEIIKAVTEFGKRYGYDFEHEKTFEKLCLVNDAVYIARSDGKWDATGAQFAHPVVFKVLFSHEPIKFADLCETKELRSGGRMYLDFNESQATPNNPYKGMHFIGKVGLFLPVLPEIGGGKLVRVKDGKSYAIGGTKDYLWLEAEMVKMLNLDAIDRLLFEDLTDTIKGTGSLTDIVDMQYYETLVDNATKTIEKFGDFQEFVK